MFWLLDNLCDLLNDFLLIFNWFNVVIFLYFGFFVSISFLIQVDFTIQANLSGRGNRRARCWNVRFGFLVGRLIRILLYGFIWFLFCGFTNLLYGFIRFLFCGFTNLLYRFVWFLLLGFIRLSWRNYFWLLN